MKQDMIFDRRHTFSLSDSFSTADRASILNNEVNRRTGVQILDESGFFTSCHSSCVSEILILFVIFCEEKFSTNFLGIKKGLDAQISVKTMSISNDDFEIVCVKHINLFLQHYQSILHDSRQKFSHTHGWYIYI